MYVVGMSCIFSNKQVELKTSHDQYTKHVFFWFL